MSIRTNRFKAVPTLLKKVVTVEKEGNLNDLKSELNKIKELFWKVKENEEELLDTLAVVDGYIRNKNIAKLREEEALICQKIRNSTRKLLPAAHTEPAGSSRQPSEDMKFKQRVELNTPLPSTPQLQKDLERIKVIFNNINRHDKRFFSSLLQFPENAVMKRSDIVLWFFRMWRSPELTVDTLLKSKLIVPHGNGKSPIASKFKINPLLRHKSLSPLFQNEEEQLCGYYSQIMSSSSSHRSDIQYEHLVLDQRKIKISDGLGFKSNHWEAVYNVGASYLNFGPGWIAKMKKLKVLQLGRLMQDSPKHHIEVWSQEFLKELSGGHEDLTRLSFRGISRIFELPPSICEIENLQSLDLKACHNLETLPSDISSLRNLRQLDLFQCYLFDRMPKGIQNLTKLRVLKGFVLGSSSKTSCRISDLAANLKDLRKLGIRIVSGAVIQDGEFQSLKELSELEHLKISWGVFDRRYIDIQIGVPSNLKKLHLEGFPGQNIPQWLKPSKISRAWGLKQQHITGGKLKSLDHGENTSYSRRWSVRIVYLKYLKHLDVDLKHLQELFPSLRYVEIKQILNQSYFEWSIN